VIGNFQAVLEKVVATAVLMPVVASMGGIAGTQTLTIVVRALALGQVGMANLVPLIRKEVAVAFLNGLLWAVVVGLVSLAVYHDWLLSLAFGSAMVINLLAAALAGVFIPLTQKRMGIDPALAGGTILTTVTDCCGFASFLGLSTILLLR
jgi:magnesium transporter